MLTPENIKGLSEAIDAVIEQCGDEPKYAPLVSSLTEAANALDHLHGNGKVEPVDPEDDPETFEGAQKAFTARKAGGSQ